MDRQEYIQPIAKKERLILVEGIDDALVVETICDRGRIREQIQVLCYSQAGKLGDFLGLLVRGAGFEMVRRIGLTRDSDKGADRALQSLQDAWHRAEQVLTEIGRRSPQPFFFALPDNQATGRLENLCLRSAVFPEILRCAEEMNKCAEAAAAYPIDQEKSIVGAYLSMMKQSGLRLGTAAQAGCWDLESEAFLPLRQFVRLLGT